jgi:hypothetical protein
MTEEPPITFKRVARRVDTLIEAIGLVEAREGQRQLITNIRDDLGWIREGIALLEKDANALAKFAGLAPKA